MHEGFRIVGLMESVRFGFLGGVDVVIVLVVAICEWDLVVVVFWMYVSDRRRFDRGMGEIL